MVFERHFEAITASATLASAIRIGNPVSIRKAINTLQRYDGIVEQATEDELADAAARADLNGLFNCPHTGVALAALFKLVKKKVIGKDASVVVISTAHGLKFSDFKYKYHLNKLSFKSKNPNIPVEAEPKLDVIRKIIDERIAKSA